MSTDTHNCPHCDEQLPDAPEHWAWLPPWQCSYCGGMYGHGEYGLFRVEANLRPFWPLFSWIEAMRFGHGAGNYTYVYVLCYPTGMPFYIGKGQGQRVCQHYRNALDPKYQHTEKERLIVQLAARGESEWYHFLALCDTDRQAYEIEQEWIARLGIRQNGGLLCNLAPAWIRNVSTDVPTNVPTETINTRESCRPVHYPLELRQSPSGAFHKTGCPFCSGRCLVPEDLLTRPVQCPHCAHLFRPITNTKIGTGTVFYSHWQQAK